MQAARDLGDDRSRLILDPDLRDRVRSLPSRTLEQTEQVPRARGPEPTDDLAGGQGLLIDGSPRHGDGVPRQT